MKRNSAFALIFTLILTSLMILIVGTFFTTSYNDLKTSDQISNSVRAYYLAEAGLAKKFMELRAGSTSSISENFSLTLSLSGSYSVTVTLVQGGIFSTYLLDSTGTYHGVSRRLTLTLRQISCARFAYFSNSEDQLFWWGSRPIWFATGDLLRGPLHSNDQLNISGDPVFDGPVSSSASSINYYHGGPPEDNPDFRQSLTLGAPGIQLPTAADILTPIKTASQEAEGLYLTGNTIITLLPDGSMNVTNAGQDWTDHNMTMPQNDSVYVQDGYVDIGGALNGQLTVGTNRSIYVVDNILYHDDPRTNPASTDMLGLVAQNNVYVDVAAPYNLEIDAYMVTLNTSFSVQSYDSVLKGTLTIYGGLTQERRGPIGTFNATTGQKVSGYTKDYNYDDRLETLAPAYFPPAKDAANRIVYLKTLWAEY